MRQFFKIAAGLLGLLVLATLVIFPATRTLQEQANVQQLVQLSQSPIETPVPAPELDRFVFGEPQVILTHTAPLDIIDWLPKRNEVLLTIQHPGTLTETIALLHLTTSEQQECGQRRRVESRPLWLNTPQRVAYVAPADTALADQNYDLWITSCGAPNAKGPVLRDVVPTIAGRSDKVLTVERAEKQGRFIDSAGKSISQRPVDFAALGFDPGNALTYFRMEGLPGDSRVAIFDKQQFVLLDGEAGSVQKVKLEDSATKSDFQATWIYQLRWSPNGRFIALLSAQGDLPLDGVQLMVFDTTSSELKQINVPFSAILSLTWSPDSAYLLLAVDSDMADGRSIGRLYLVDLQGSYRPVLPDYTVSSGTYLFSGGGLLWSPDGQTILTRCSVWAKDISLITEDRLCAVQVSQEQR